MPQEKLHQPKKGLYQFFKSFTDVKSKLGYLGSQWPSMAFDSK